MNLPSPIPFLDSPGEETFAPLFEAHRNLVWRICLKILRSPEDAEEAFQSTWARLLHIAHHPQHRPPLRGGPDGLMAHLAILEADALRKRRGRRANREVVMPDLPDSPSAGRQAEAAYTGEIAAALQQSIDELPENLRDAATLHYLAGLTQRQVAEALTLPEGTVATRLRSARQRLADALRRRGITNADATLAAAIAAAALLTAPASATAQVCYAAALAAQGSLAASAGTLAPATAASLSTGAKLAVATAAAFLILLVGGFIIHQHNTPPPPAPTPRVVAVATPASPAATPAPTATPTPTPAAPVATPAPTPEPAPAPEPAFRVRGHIRDLAGSPVPGAEVHLEAVGIQLDRDTPRLGFNHLATVLSADDGSYDLASPTDGLHCLLVRKEGFETAREHLIDESYLEGLSAEKQSHIERDIQLGPERVLSVLVRTSGGQPIAGAAVHVMIDGTGDERILVLHEGRTNESGRAELRGLSRGQGTALAIADGHPRAHARLLHDETELTLEPSDRYAALIGRVVADDDGRPLAGARVVATAEDEMPWQGLAPTLDAVADAQGLFAFPLLPPRQHQLQVILPDFQIAGDPAEARVEASDLAAGTHEITLRMHQVRANRYKVVERDSLAPLAGVRVQIVPAIAKMFGLDDFEATTDADGIFECEAAVADGMGNVFLLEKEGYRSLQQLQPSADGPMLVLMEPAVTLRGRVLRQSDEPLAGAALILSHRSRDTQNSQDYPAGVTAEDGSFAIPVPHDVPFHLLVMEGRREAGRWGPARYTESPAEPILVRVDNPVRIEGIVLDTADAPVVAARINIASVLVEQGPDYVSRRNLYRDVVQSDAQGRFRAEVGNLEHVRLSVEASGFAQVSDIRPNADGSVRIVLRASEPLRGRVVDEAGKGLAGFRIDVYDPDASGHFNTVSGAEGRFAIDGVQPDSKRIRITARDTEGLGVTAENLSPGPEEHQLVVRTRGLLTLLGEVVDAASGKPLAFKEPMTSSGRIRLREPGFFTIDGIKPGEKVQVTLTPDGLPRQTFAWEAPATPQQDVHEETFKALRGGAIVGRVLGEEDDAPLVGASVYVADHPGARGGRNALSATTDDAGRFRLDNVLPGMRFVRVSVEGQRLQVLHHEFRTGHEDDLGDIRLAPPQHWAVRLVDQSGGRGIAHESLALTINPDRWVAGEIDMQAQATTNEEGLARFFVPAGRHARLRNNALQLDYLVPHASIEEPHVVAIGRNRLSGTVVYRGKPVPATIWLSDAATNQSRFVTTADAQGDFAFTRLPQGEFRVRSSPPREGNVVFETRVTIPASGPLHIVIPYTELRGVVRRADGSPVASAPIRLHPTGDKPRTRAHHMFYTTGQDGSFTIAGMEPGRHGLSIDWSGKTFELGEFDVVAEQEPERLELTLPE
ncbi:MAG: sigma-70 family RNA polymerase sigma factor [Candidatus Sumerlaeia bacterium]|nr:sigma-70 family RNA polymerase sigma factor [Candidatus Sumerlaeia bacterium]